MSQSEKISQKTLLLFSSFLMRSKIDPKTVQALLRHSDVKTTLQLYAHSVSEDRMAAQGEMLEAILRSSSEAVN